MMFSIILFLSLALNVYPQQNKKIYIFKLKISGTQDKTLEKKIRNTLILNIINNYKGKYSIVDEDSLLELSEKLKKLQLYGCSDEICMKEISNAIDADEFISGEIVIEKDIYKLDMRNTLKNRETFETSIKSIVNESFYSFQLEYFLEEITKKLINPNYIIDKKNAPIKFPTSLKFSELEMKSLDKLPEISLGAKGNKKLEILLDTLKSYLLQADMLFSAKDYEKALQSYKAILNTSTETTRNEEREKLLEFINLTKQRIQITQNLIFSNELSMLDKEFNEADSKFEYEEILEKYIELLKRYTLLQNYERSSKLDLAIRERIIYIYEKQGQFYYKNLEFSKAYEVYNLAKNYANIPELQKKREEIQSNLNTVVKSGANYVENIVKTNCDEAEVLNTKYEIEYKGTNSTRAREYKYQAIAIMERTADFIEKEKSFLTDSVVHYYDHTVKNLNRDSGELLLTPTNILLFPIRYIGNLLKGIADIFVFKFGWGLGGGAELGPVGMGGFYGYFPLEYSTAYPKTRSKLQENNTEKDITDLKGRNTYWGFGYGYAGTCLNLFFRACNDLKQYTVGHVWVGAGPSLYVGVELHRALEYVGVVFFQNWDLLGYPTKRFEYFSYKKLEPLSKKFQTKRQLPIYSVFSEEGVAVGTKIAHSGLLEDPNFKVFISEKNGILLKSEPKFTSSSLGYIPYETEGIIIDIGDKVSLNSDLNWIKIRTNTLEGWLLNNQILFKKEDKKK